MSLAWAGSLRIGPRFEALEIHLAAGAEVRRLHVGRQASLDGPRFRPDVEIERETLCRSRRRDVDRRMQGVPGRRRHDAADLRQRHVPGGREPEDRRLRILFDDAVDLQRRLVRNEFELPDVQIAVVHRQRAGQLLQSQRRRSPAERHVIERDGVVGRRVGHRRLHVQIANLVRHAQGVACDVTRDVDATVRDRDRGEGDCRAGLLRLGRRPGLHQVREVPAIRPPLDPDVRLINPEVVENHPVPDDLEDAVVDLQRLDRQDARARHVDRHVRQIGAEEQVSAEPADRQLAVQGTVWIRGQCSAAPSRGTTASARR